MRKQEGLAAVEWDLKAAGVTGYILGLFELALLLCLNRAVQFTPADDLA